MMGMHKRKCPNCSGIPKKIFDQISAVDNKTVCKTCNGEGDLYYVDGSLVSKETFREINIDRMFEIDHTISTNENKCIVCGIGLDPDFAHSFDGCCSECYDPGT